MKTRPRARINTCWSSRERGPAGRFMNESDFTEKNGKEFYYGTEF